MVSRRDLLKSGALLVPAARAAPKSEIKLENDAFCMGLDETSGAIRSLIVKRNRCELIGEKRLAANFRICLPWPDYQCNYIEGTAQRPADLVRSGDSVTVAFSGMRSEKGEVPLDLSYTIALDGDCVRFRARLANRSAYPVSEFWFPRIGGWTGFGGRDALLATPGYTSCRHTNSLFKSFPGRRGLGAEAAEYTTNYPGMVMPWWDVFDRESGTGLYLGYHDKTFRISTWHCYLWPDASGNPEDAWLTDQEAAGAPVGLVFSHVRYPFIKSGETFDAGEFVVRVHEGDWHQGSKHYRKWFMGNFPFDKSRSWLRKKSAWFTSIVYQPEDRITADYQTYDQWCRDAEKFGINCHELIGWHSGGLERNYPDYFPEEKLGGRPGFRNLLASIKSRGSRCLAFVNYNIIDGATEQYRSTLRPFTRKDQFGQTPNNMAWGESTLIARLGFSVHRHMVASVVPPFQELLERHLLRTVQDGADGFQIDKLNVGSALDFNPLNTRKPDEALCEGLVQGIASLLEKCRKINPEFCIASEATEDRLIPYVDVYYRNSSGPDIAPLRYVFPEWTSAQHISGARDFRSVNGAVLTGSVICVEPRTYSGTLADPLYRDLANYIREVERIRHALANLIFLGAYFDEEGASITEVGGQPGTALVFRVHGHASSGRRAIVVSNYSPQPRAYTWRFTHRSVARARLYAPFEPVKEVAAASELAIPPIGLHILVE